MWQRVRWKTEDDVLKMMLSHSLRVTKSKNEIAEMDQIQQREIEP
jgi:hypothetical protein